MMREYGKMGPAMWTRGSGKRLRGDALGQAIASYLCTSHHANMLGLYYIAIPTIAHDTGHSVDEVRAALKRLADARFAFYDEEEGIVFIPNGAAFQIGDTLKPLDKRVEGIAKELRAIGSHRFVDDFLRLYGEAYCLGSKGLRWGFEGASEPSEGPPARAGASAPSPDAAPVAASAGVQGGSTEAPPSQPPPAESVSRVRDEAPFPMPDDFPLTGDARASAETMGVANVDDEWIGFRARQIRDAKVFTTRQWYAAWISWCVRAKGFASEARTRDRERPRAGPLRARALQPVPPDAPWMREDYNDAIAEANAIAAGKAPR